MTIRVNNNISVTIDNSSGRMLIESVPGGLRYSCDGEFIMSIDEFIEVSDGLQDYIEASGHFGDDTEVRDSSDYEHYLRSDYYGVYPEDKDLGVMRQLQLVRSDNGKWSICRQSHRNGKFSLFGYRYFSSNGATLYSLKGPANDGKYHKTWYMHGSDYSRDGGPLDVDKELLIAVLEYNRTSGGVDPLD